MSDESLFDRSLADQQWEYMYNQWLRDGPIRDKVSAALTEASAAFAAQVTEPDACKYMEACDQLTNFLDLNNHMEESELKLLLQVLQVACAVHENAVNNTELTETQRSSHQLASTSLFKLSQSVLNGSILYSELWHDGLRIGSRAEKAFNNATAGVAKQPNLDCLHETSAPLSPVPTASGVPMPGASLHDTTGTHETPKSISIKEKALAMLNERPTKAQALGRAHTMPALHPTSSSRPSRTGRTPSNACSCEHGLQALQEISEE